jgi:hypothetical protein
LTPSVVEQVSASSSRSQPEQPGHPAAQGLLPLYEGLEEGLAAAAVLRLLT